MIFKKNQELKENKEIVKELERLRQSHKLMMEEIENIKKDQELPLQKIGLVRFNPFPGVGGDYSFALAIVNKNNDGVLITSFYNTEGSSIYTKLIKNGGVDHPLIEEEKNALEQALRKCEKETNQLWKKKNKK